MGWLHDDRLLWLAVACSSLAVTWACFHALDNLDAATETTAPVKQFCVVNQQTENEISAADLVTLSKHPVRHISEAAVKVLVLRAVHDDELVGAIEKDLVATSKACGRDPHDLAFNRALKAKKLLCKYDPDCFARWRRKYRPRRAAAAASLSVRQYVYDGAESTIQDLLGDLDAFARQSAEGEDGDSDSDDDADSASDSDSSDAEDTYQGARYVMAALDAAFNQSPLPSRVEPARHARRQGNGTHAVGQDLPRSRDRAANPDEQARRRRRREAIVLNEGNRPLTQQNIIQRRTTQND